MFSLTRKEQIVVFLLVFSLFVGGVISFLDWLDSRTIEEFQVVPGVVEPPPKPPADESKTSSRHSFGGKLNVNLATIEELEGLPNIGPKMAKRIVRFREKNGPFKSVEDLRKVQGIGEKTLEGLKPLVEVE